MSESDIEYLKSILRAKRFTTTKTYVKSVVCMTSQHGDYKTSITIHTSGYASICISREGFYTTYGYCGKERLTMDVVSLIQRTTYVPIQELTKGKLEGLGWEVI